MYRSFYRKPGSEYLCRASPDLFNSTFSGIRKTGSNIDFFGVKSLCPVQEGLLIPPDEHRCVYLMGEIKKLTHKTDLWANQNAAVIFNIISL